MRQILVLGEKTFRLTIPDDAKVTFGPWSPPNAKKGLHSYDSAGTLRIYVGSKDNCIGCFSGVTGYRDLSLQYEEQVAKEEGAAIWKSDKDGYRREEKVQRQTEWVVDVVPALPRKRGRK